MRRDDGGQFWGTLFDVVSLVVSVVEVVANPTDPWAWAGLAGDVVDLLPIVSGCGETVDAIRVANKADKIVDAIDNVHDTAESLDESRKIADRTLKRIRSAAKKLHGGDNYVYISRGADGIIDYVGITNDFVRRKTEWSTKGRKIVHYMDGLDRKSARVVEQTIIETFGMSKNGGRLTNKINSISTKNPLYEAVKSFKKLIK